MKQAKICLVGNSLSSGGADRIHAVLSTYFVSKGIEVSNVIFIDNVTYEFSGSLLNLGTMKRGDGPFDLLKRFRFLQRFFKEQHFDYIIDFRNRFKPWQEWLFTRMLYKCPYIITVHSYRADWYIPGNRWPSRHIFKDAYGLVAVSKEIEHRIREEYGYSNVKTLYNPLQTGEIEKLSQAEIGVDGKFVLGVGRMENDNNKQFDGMITAYAASSLPSQGIRLVLLGDGPQQLELRELAAALGLRDKVVFRGFVPNPYAYLAKAHCTLLTSRNEGFPNTIAESLACGTPVVSFDCKSGPAELIDDRVNGFLIPDQDFAKFTAALNEITENSTLYRICKSNAKSSVAHLNVAAIGQQWLDYLQLNTI